MSTRSLWRGETETAVPAWAAATTTTKPPNKQASTSEGFPSSSHLPLTLWYLVFNKHICEVLPMLIYVDRRISDFLCPPNFSSTMPYIHSFISSSTSSTPPPQLPSDIRFSFLFLGSFTPPSHSSHLVSLFSSPKDRPAGQCYRTVLQSEQGGNIPALGYAKRAREKNE